MDHSEHVRLARATIEAYVTGATLPDAFMASEELRSQKAGAFVSLKKQGALRGCIGTIEPVYSNLAEEIIRNAIQSATADPRFAPVSAAELADLTISVDVLHPAEAIGDPSQLDPRQYGVIVSCGTRKGLLLPNLEGVDTIEDQVSIACQKACIAAGEPLALQRFRVDRFT